MLHHNRWCDAGRDSMPPLTDTRERLISSASELFWERGYAATGLSDILDAAGARGGSLYHFFPTKDDLLLAVIEYQASVLETAIENAMAAQSEPIAKILAVGEFYRSFMRRTNCSLGCPLTNLAGEIADTHPAARERIGAFLDMLVSRVRQGLDELGAPDSERHARTIVAMIHGGVTHARTCRDTRTLDACMDMLAATLVSLRPQVVTRPVLSGAART